MMIYNKNLSVVPISTHIPVREISQNLNKNLIEKKVNN